ncbi:glycoside hydrolase N-terminal domain-containing protein [Treponema sp.]|uniref:glycoside hydrolase family 95 protein n=1 Tax=Treponema sp. TaxID=166 RepID=UPI00388FA5C6
MSKLIDKTPAQNFKDAFPVANGRIGAKVYGNPGHEILKLNEESLWSKAFYDRNNPQSLKAIKDIRTLVSQDRLVEAQEQVLESLSGIPKEQACCCPSGEIHLDFYDAEHSKSKGFDKHDSYRREIDFETGIVTSEFSIESSISGEKDFSRGSSDRSITYTRECFASGSGNVLVYHISSSVPKSIYLRASIVKSGCAKKYALTNDTISVLDVNGFPSCIMMTAVASGGAVSVKGEYLVVEKSDYVTLYIDVETGYRRGHFRSKQGDVHKKPLAAASKCADLALKRICFASGTSYENLKSDHIADWSSWNSQAILSIDGKENPEWEYAKYKLLCDLHPQATLPKTKYGLWSENGGERFCLTDNSIYRHAAGMAGLSRLNGTLFKFAARLYRHGKATSESMYGSEGFVCHGSTDIWGDAAPCGTDLSTSYSPLGALAFAKALIEYYEYTLDMKVLKKYFKILKAASTFFLNQLVPVDEKKHLVLTPAFTESCMAENSREDSIAIRDIFALTLRAMKYLGKNSDSLAFDISDAEKKLDVAECQSAENRTTDTEDFDGWLCSARDSIIKCRMNNGRVEITLLESIPEDWKNGSLKNVQLMGNITCDIEWKDLKLENALLHVEPGIAFCKNLFIIYEGKGYETHLSGDGTLDVRNILPSTI